MPPKRRKLADGVEDVGSDDLDFDPTRQQQQAEERISLGKRRMDQQNSLDNLLKSKGAKIEEFIKEKSEYTFKDKKWVLHR